MENWKVYMHIFPNEKRYIGITKQKPEYRWGHNGNGYYQHKMLTNAIRKYGWENIKHNIIFEGLTKKEAEDKEIELIAFYKSNQRKYGYNIANGGTEEGKHSKETRAKMSMKAKGRKVSQETREKRSQSLKGIPKTEDWKKKIGLGNKGKIISDKQKKLFSDIRSKAVFCVELNKSFKNAKEAAIYLGHQNRGTNIQNAVNNKNKTAYGYHWEYIC